MLQWFYEPEADPDYKQIVEKSLALFGVFTGAALSFYTKDFLFGTEDDVTFGLPFWSRLCVVIAVIALLLRYIVGSAVHLNATYVAKTSTTAVQVATEQGEPITLKLHDSKEYRQMSLELLFFDMLMLVLFGVLGASIAFAHSFRELMWRAFAFVGAGLLWGIIAAIWREKDRTIAWRWIAIDAVQLAITLALILLSPSAEFTSVVLAPVYVACLYFDFLVVSRPKKDEKKAAVA